MPASARSSRAFDKPDFVYSHHGCEALSGNCERADWARASELVPVAIAATTPVADTSTFVSAARKTREYGIAWRLAKRSAAHAQHDNDESSGFSESVDRVATAQMTLSLVRVSDGDGVLAILFRAHRKHALESDRDARERAVLPVLAFSAPWR